jgi:hypothetical protein
VSGRSSWNRVHQLFKSASTPLPTFSSGAPEEKGTIVFRVILQDGHNEHEPIEICKPQYGVDVEISACTTRGLVNVAEDSARQGRTGLVAATYKASLRLCRISCEQKRKLIELVQILTKDCVTVLATRILINLDGSSSCHSFVSK